MQREAVLACWAKTRLGEPGFHPLISHMLDSAAVCGTLSASAWPLSALPRLVCSYIVALHDIGKADPRFQNKDAERTTALRELGFTLSDRVVPFRHESRSFEWVRDQLQHDHAWRREPATVVAQALQGHHGQFRVAADYLDELDQRRPEWDALRRHIAALVAETLGVQSPSEPQIADASAFGAALSGMVVVCDWIASNEEVYRYWELPPADDLRRYYDAACAEAARAVARLRLQRSTRGATRPESFVGLWPQITAMRPVQSALEDVCRSGPPLGLAIIEAPMGDGKTEAAIYLAEHWRGAGWADGAYIALPTAATSNQMHHRYQDFLASRRPEVTARLVHGMAWLLDDASPGNGSATFGEDDSERDLSREWFRNARRALLAPEAVGTVDQALTAALNVKFGFLRLFGLSRKVLIVDEVHAYDAYMSTILCRLLQWCRAMETPVILLSATLSSSQKRQLVEAYGESVALPPSDGDEPYPLLTFVPLSGGSRSIAVPDSRRRTVAVRNHYGLLGDHEATARLALEQVAAGGCACVIANTVADAQATYRALEKQVGDDGPDLILFHARFRAERRRELEERVTALFGKEAGRARPHRAVLVATQVVEQSLDLDFDVMISQLAPVDLLLQRTGRLHRHSRGARPTGLEATLHVLLPKEGSFQFGATERIYQREPLLRTLALIHDRESLDLPKDFRRLIEGCYGDAPLPQGVVPEEVLAAAVTDHRDRLAKAESEAHLHLIPEPSPREFRLAYNSQQPVMEGDEGASRDYFHAQTRLGDPRVRVLVLHDPGLAELASADEPPDKELLRRLFLQMVDLPAWWLLDLTQDEGFAPVIEGPKWLNRLAVLAMNDGEWRGRDSKGRLVVLRDDPQLGMQRETPTDAGSEEARDADV